MFSLCFLFIYHSIAIIVNRIYDNFQRRVKMNWKKYNESNEPQFLNHVHQEMQKDLTGLVEAANNAIHKIDMLTGNPKNDNVKDKLYEIRDILMKALPDNKLRAKGFKPSKPIKENSNLDFSAGKVLAEELGVDPDNDIWLTSEYDYYEPDYEYGVKLPDGHEATYVVYDNEESAKTSAADDLGEHFQEEASILGAAIDYFGFETFKEYVNGLDEDELEDLEQLKDEMGEEEFARYVIDNIGVDYRGFAEYNIEQLGAAWHLANYDSNEIELPNGMLAYRVD